ncbi:MAG: nickel-responsive transcriptional regulator NikR [Thermoplasmata archaeon]|nr:MAG: nickel-responsive transcriptional regulator NikR [Thermoplasmata archaeon]
MEKVVRVGISLDPGLLTRFDDLIKGEGYTNRSEAIRDLIRRRLAERDVEEGNSEVVGTITMIYDHHSGDVTDRLLHLQHHHLDVITVSSHLHVDERLCMEAVLVRGRYGEVRALFNEIKSLKGVLKADLSVTPLSLRI